jgi:hypothetical protein
MMAAATSGTQQNAIMDADSAATAAFWAVKDKELGDSSELVRTLTNNLKKANLSIKTQLETIQDLSTTLAEITAAVQMAATIALVAFA